jgi:hypothetical protein
VIAIAGAGRVSGWPHRCRKARNASGRINDGRQHWTAERRAAFSRAPRDLFVRCLSAEVVSLVARAPSRPARPR